MPSVREFFLHEAGEYLDHLARLLEAASDSGVDAKELLRLARALRGSAQMAREETVRCVAQVLETAARGLTTGALAWRGDVGACVRRTLEDLRHLVAADETEGEAALRIAGALQRWSDLGIEPPPGTIAPPPTPAGAGDRPAGGALGAEFRAYASRELSRIVSAFDLALPALSREPLGREPLKSIMRQQRALLGAAQIDRLPVVAEVLRTVDEMTRRVAELKVAVEGEWLELYTAARDVLAVALSALERGGTPAPDGPALERLRGLRAALGASEAPRGPSAAPPAAAGEVLPAEVAGFFQTEARAILDRVGAMAGEFAASTAGGRALLAGEMGAALSALRDTARTFGFARAGQLAESALDQIAAGRAARVLDMLPDLRAAAAEAPGGVVDRPGDAAGQPTDAADVSPPATEPAGAGGAGASTARRPTAASPAPAEAPADSEVVPIESLLYRGEAALRRAQELRSLIEPAVMNDAAARAAIDELFDLMRYVDLEGA